jgi:hypothetical protein
MALSPNSAALKQFNVQLESPLRCERSIPYASLEKAVLVICWVKGSELLNYRFNYGVTRYVSSST